MKAQSKYLIGLFFVLALAFIGLFIGTWMGAAFFVPEGSGLAGAAIALGYGVIGVVVAVIVGIVTARVLSLSVLRKVTLVVGIVALVLVGIVTYRIVEGQREQAAQQAATPPSPYQLPYTMRLEVTDAGRSDAMYGLPFRTIEIENELEGGTFELLTAEARPRRCRGALAGLEPVDISSGLQRTAATMASHFTPCTHDTAGTVLHHLAWDLTVDSSMPEGEIGLTRGCLDQQEGPRDLVRYLRDLHTRMVPTMTCELVSVGASATPRVQLAALTHSAASRMDEGLPLGIGIVKPSLVAGQTLYLYGAPDFDKMPGQLTPYDSLTFAQGPYYVEITYAPPWFAPEVMKLDYDALMLRAETLAQNWIEVVVSEGKTRWDPRTLWVDRNAVGFETWPEFLLHVASVEVLDPVANPLRSGPGDETARMGEAPGALLLPLAVQGQWMRVKASDIVNQDAPSGWVRWHDGERLLIRYSLRA